MTRRPEVGTGDRVRPHRTGFRSQPTKAAISDREAIRGLAQLRVAFPTHTIRH